MEVKIETQFSPDPSSTFSFSFELELEGGNDASTVAAVPPYSGIAALFVSLHPDPCS